MSSNNGITATHLVAQSGNLELYDVLREYNAVEPLLGRRMDNGWTPLFFACQNGHLAVCRLLLQCASTAVNATDTEGKTPLYFAAQEGHGDIVAELLSNGASVDGAFQSARRTAFPLFIAAQQGHLEIVRQLLQAGAQCNLQKKGSGATALHIAAWDGHLKIVRVLIAAGASPHIATQGGWTCLHTACRGGHLDVVQFLTQGETARLLRQSRDNEDEAQPRGCLRLHLRSSAKAQTAASPLHIAAGSGHSRIVDYLLSRRLFSPDACMAGAATPLHIAAQEGHLSTVQVLTLYDASRSPRTSQGVTPAAIADHRGHGKIVDWLEKTDGWCRFKLAMHVSPQRAGRMLAGESIPARDILDCYHSVVPELLAPGETSQAAVALCSRALLPWRPTRHNLFSPGFRKHVAQVLMLAARLWRVDSPFQLPHELWWLVVSQSRRT